MKLKTLLLSMILPACLRCRAIHGRRAGVRHVIHPRQGDGTAPSCRSVANVRPVLLRMVGLRPPLFRNNHALERAQGSQTFGRSSSRGRGNIPFHGSGGALFRTGRHAGVAGRYAHADILLFPLRSRGGEGGLHCTAAHG